MSAFRTVGLLSLVAALAIGGFAFKMDSSGSGGPGGSVTTEVNQAVFTAADVSLSAYRASAGTFVGAPPPQGMTLARADEASYCIQTVQNGAVEHEAGPGGQPSPGPCS
jgi:hypothetical protein